MKGNRTRQKQHLTYITHPPTNGNSASLRRQNTVRQLTKFAHKLASISTMNIYYSGSEMRRKYHVDMEVMIIIFAGRNS